MRGDSFVTFPLAHHVPVAETSHRNLPLGDVKEGVEKFKPLRIVLGAIPAVYANHEVRRKSPSQIPPLSNKFPGIRRNWEEG